MRVKLGNERWPKNKVRVLSCDANGNLFTQFLGRSTYKQITETTGQMDISHTRYATIYWDNGNGKFSPLYVEIGKNETWALERIMEHALRSAIIPDVLKKYPKEIIKMGEFKHDNSLEEKAYAAPENSSVIPSKVLQRLPYYREQDIEVSVPIYKAKHAFPLIILKLLPKMKTTPPGQRPALVLDNDGDILTVNFSSAAIVKAKRKLTALEKKDAKGYLICLQSPEGISIEVMETTKLQEQALENVIRRFEEKNSKKQPVSATVKKVLNKVRDRVRTD